jgi:hypothetical protein
MLVMALSRQHWSWRDAKAESTGLAVAQCHYQLMLVTVLPSSTGDDVAESTLAMKYCHCWAMVVTALPGQLGRDMM